MLDMDGCISIYPTPPFSADTQHYFVALNVFSLVDRGVPFLSMNTVCSTVYPERLVRLRRSCWGGENRSRSRFSVQDSEIIIARQLYRYLSERTFPILTIARCPIELRSGPNGRR